MTNVSESDFVRALVKQRDALQLRVHQLLDEIAVSSNKQTGERSTLDGWTLENAVKEIERLKVGRIA